MRILIVEDTPELADNMLRYLQREGYSCKLGGNLREAEDFLVDHEFDLMILDLMLPDGDGLDLLFQIRRQHQDLGVLIVSAKGDLDDKLTGLDLGADDYLTKPFHLSELNARLKAIYRRRKMNGRQKLTCHEITVDPETMEVEVHQDPLLLTRKEYELLLYFLSNQNRMLTKQSIAEYLWGDRMDVN
ncbi:MAG: response regulator transcription factor, partial [Bacteroidota bacterium]